MRSTKEYLLLVLKGAGMGAADVVPGVSGGTIAFITGIYEELIKSLRSINIHTVKILFKGKVLSFLNAINGFFLIALFGGVALSIFSLARLMKWLLSDYPVPVWSFFFGLILCSAFIVLRSAGKFRYAALIPFTSGILVSFIITTLTPATTPETYWFLFLAGSVSICAMILPGISGAFILLLLGKYLFIITAVSEFNISVIAVFIAGAVIGLILFSNVLGWLLDRYRIITITILAGFMLGSLNKVWPWKITTSSIIDAHGEMVPLSQKNVLPSLYSVVENADPLVIWAIILFIAGITIPVLIESMAGKRD